MLGVGTNENDARMRTSRAPRRSSFFARFFGPAFARSGYSSGYLDLAYAVIPEHTL